MKERAQGKTQTQTKEEVAATGYQRKIAELNSWIGDNKPFFNEIYKACWGKLDRLQFVAASIGVAESSKQLSHLLFNQLVAAVGLHSQEISMKPEDLLRIIKAAQPPEHSN